MNLGKNRLVACGSHKEALHSRTLTPQKFTVKKARNNALELIVGKHFEALQPSHFG